MNIRLRSAVSRREAVRSGLVAHMAAGLDRASNKSDHLHRPLVADVRRAGMLDGARIDTADGDSHAAVPSADT